MIRQPNLLRLLSSEYRWLQHLLFWLAFYFPRILDMIQSSSSERVVVHVFMLASNLFLLYFNIYYLLPEYFSRGQVRTYLIGTVGTVCSMAIVNASFIEYLATNEPFHIASFTRIAEYSVFTLSLLMTALAFHIFKRFMASQSQLKTSENAQLQTEINFLKSQINPHFLFNALNNIQVQLRTQPAQAADNIGHLSALLRYQLYDSAKESVRLQDEVDFLRNFLQINHMRTGQNEVDFQIEGDLEGIRVSPYLFIPFVENAVKHSRGLGGRHQLRIKLIADRKEVFFEIENTKPQVADKKTSTAGGIGLINISRRLDLLYPKRYQLEISNAYNAYLIRLRVKIT
jgi:two-component system, LytTR family, sensor kinase